MENPLAHRVAICWVDGLDPVRIRQISERLANDSLFADFAIRRYDDGFAVVVWAARDYLQLQELVNAYVLGHSPHERMASVAAGRE